MARIPHDPEPLPSALDRCEQEIALARSQLDFAKTAVAAPDKIDFRVLFAEKRLRNALANRQRLVEHSEELDPPRE